MDKNTRKEVDANKLELSLIKPDWVVPIDESSFDQQMKDIFRFFVMESPCPDISTLGKALDAYGWKKSDYQKGDWLEKRILAIMELEPNKTLYIGKRRKDMKDIFRQAGMSDDFHTKYNTNRVCMLQNGCFVLDLCRHIRNSLAHFRFAIGGVNSETLIFEDGKKFKDKFETKARMVIKKDTLIEAIKMIKDGVKIKNDEILAEEKRTENSIIKLIAEKNARTQKELKNILGIKEKMIKQAIDRLKSAKQIRYNDHKHCWEIVDDKETAA